MRRACWIVNAVAGILAALAAPAAGGELKFIKHQMLNETFPGVDGQWQGITLASDGNVYFAVGSHSAGVGAPFLRYDPRTDTMKTLTRNITLQCGETPGKTPDQGKIHSEIIEHKGWLYFGTHLADYSGWGFTSYTGGHLVGYEMATETFRDFGVIHPNYTNYSGIGLDRQREKMWFWMTDLRANQSSLLYRVDLKTGKKESGERKLIGNRAVFYFFVDRRGDCWFMAPEGPGGNQLITLFVARAETGELTQYPASVMPDRIFYNWTAKPIDEERALIQIGGRFHIFEPKKFDGVALKTALTPLCQSDFHGISGVACHNGKRFYWTCGARGSHLWSASFDHPEQVVDHGVLRDPLGRPATNLCSMVADDKGRLYVVARWEANDEDKEKKLAVKRDYWVVVHFSVLDVSVPAEAEAPKEKK